MKHLILGALTSIMLVSSAQALTININNIDFDFDDTVDFSELYEAIATVQASDTTSVLNELGVTKLTSQYSSSADKYRINIYQGTTKTSFDGETGQNKIEVFNRALDDFMITHKVDYVSGYDAGYAKGAADEKAKSDAVIEDEGELLIPATDEEIDTALALETITSNTPDLSNLTIDTGGSYTIGCGWAGCTATLPNQSITASYNGKTVTESFSTTYSHISYHNSSYVYYETAAHAVANVFDKYLEDAIEASIEIFYEAGYDDGYEDGFNDGFDAGWSAAEDHHGIE